MKKIIKQIIYSFVAIVMIIGLTTGNANAQSGSQPVEGDACNYEVDTALLSDSSNPAGFLQCHPRGSYISMPCAPGTVFSVKEQVCIQTGNSGDSKS